jgi:ABC-type branched-subunit amino acid transport system substrate-binding protein
VVALLVCCGVYVGVGGERWGTYRYFSGRCADGVWQRGPDDECVGVTDGSYAFGSLDEVSQAIEKENDRVTRGSRPYVTIALFLPMTTAETDPNRKAAEERQIRHEVLGAHLAQLRANEEAGVAVRLVLANPGRGSRQYAHVADQLAAMTGSDAHLRAVVGFDVSDRTTKRALTHLTQDLGIPVVGGPVTGTDLTMPGFARVVPTNEDQARVLATIPSGKRTSLVEDTRLGDSYVATLRRAFDEQRADDAPEPEKYESKGNSQDEALLADDFANIAQDICQSGSRDVYFAGRPPQLRQLVQELGGHACAETHSRFRVITGSGASTVDSYVDEDDIEQWRAALRHVTVVYAAVGHPESWEDTEAPEAADAQREVRKLEGQLRALGLDRANLEDSRLMTIYDATRTAVKNIRLQLGGDERIPRLDEVWGGWRRLKGSEKVHGTTGWICLANDGNAYDKAVHLVSLDPAWKEGRKITFERVVWPAGEKLEATCTAPRSDNR